jgi:lactate 2-monooxygenase
MTTDPNLWEAAAAATMALDSFAYLKGGAGAGETIGRNRQAFEKWAIVPRMVQANTRRKLHVQVFGSTWPAPIA